MRAIGLIAIVELRRLFRERSNYFFVFVFPLALVVVIGSAVGGYDPRIALVVPDDVSSDRTVAELVDGLEALDGVTIERSGSRDDALELLRREEVVAAVVIPADAPATVAAGGQLRVGYLATPAGGGAELRSLVAARLAEQSAVLGAGRLAAEEGAGSVEEAVAVARGLAPERTGVGVEVVRPDGTPWASSGDAVSLVAAQQLVLFMFITGLTSAAALIRIRELGVVRRMLAAPVPPRDVLLGAAGGRLLTNLFQGLYILVATALVLGVDWGDLGASLAVALLFGLCATGAAMLVGALFRNESQASGISVFLGLVLGAIGGCMVPLEVFPDTLRTVAHLTPHAWAIDAYTTIVLDAGSYGDVATELGVLALYGVTLFGTAAVVLRRAIMR